MESVRIGHWKIMRCCILKSIQKGHSNNKNQNGLSELKISELINEHSFHGLCTKLPYF